MTRLFILSAAGLLLAAGCREKEVRTGADAPVVDVAAARLDSVTVYKEFPGYLGAMREVDLVTRVDGNLSAVSYTPGARVEQGQLLFSINPDVFANAVEQARASLDDARASLDYNRRNYAAMQQALDADAVSQMEVLQAHSDLLTAEAALQSAEAALRTAEITLSHCYIRAPFAGRVSECPYSVGAYFSGSDDPVTLARIYDDAEMKAYFSVTTDDYARLQGHTMHPDMPLLFDEPLQSDYTADFSYFAPAINRATGTVSVTARVENPTGELRSGMFVNVELPVATLPEAVVVRAEAVGRDQRGEYLYTIAEGSRVAYSPVEVEATIGDSICVISKGIAAGTLYVTKALLKVRPGMIVNPKIVQP